MFGFTAPLAVNVVFALMLTVVLAAVVLAGVFPSFFVQLLNIYPLDGVALIDAV